MTISGHLAVASFVLAVTRNPWLVGPACLTFHYVADAVPHVEWQPWRQAAGHVKSLMAIDAVATLLISWRLYAAFPLEPSIVSLAILASVIPDLIDPVTRKQLPTLRRFHIFLHTWPQRPDEPIDWGRTVSGKTPNAVKVLMQLALVLVATAQLFLRPG